MNMMPRIMALFQKRIDGDDALLRLASLRFGKAGLGPEFYADTPDELEYLLSFRPSPEAPAAVHLRREINLFDEGSRSLISDFASRFAGRVFGMVVHDQTEIPARFEDYISAVKEMGQRLARINNGPYLFIEYAVFLDPELFLEIFRRIKGEKRISACIDIGHVGIRQTCDAFSRKHPGADVCSLKPDDPGLPEIIADVQEAMSSALPAVLHMVRELGKLKKPVHFHLHDAHPLSTFSPFGVSDHLSFFQEIPIPFEYRGGKTLPTMYGPSGLSEIVKTSLESLGGERVSFSLEIHPVEGREPLGDAGYLFNHWKDKTNAEKMNCWLSVLIRNNRLLREVCSLPPADNP